LVVVILIYPSIQKVKGPNPPSLEKEKSRFHIRRELRLI
jgi:hypothetical protein